MPVLGGRGDAAAHRRYRRRARGCGRFPWRTLPPGPGAVREAGGGSGPAQPWTQRHPAGCPHAGRHRSRDDDHRRGRRPRLHGVRRTGAGPRPAPGSGGHPGQSERPQERGRRRGRGSSALPAGLLTRLQSDRTGLRQSQGIPTGAAAERTPDGLRKATAVAIDAISATDAQGFYAHCGFPLPVD